MIGFHKGFMLDHVPQPVAGHYRCRLQHGGVFVAVKIEVVEERDEAGDLTCDVEYRAWANGEPVAIDAVWPWCLNYPLTEQEYSNRLMGVK